MPIAIDPPATPIVSGITILPPSSSIESTITVEYPDQPIQTLTVIEEVKEISIITAGVPGPPGATLNIPEFLQATAGEDLGGHRVVQVFDGIATYANNQDTYYGQLALTVAASMNGDDARFFTSGVVIEPTWNFVIGAVYLGVNGLLTQTRPETGTVVIVGRAVSATSISLNFQQLYRRV